MWGLQLGYLDNLASSRYLLRRNDTAALARIEVGAHFGKGEMYAIRYSEGRHDMTADEEYVVIPGVRGRVDDAGWWL